MGNILTTNAIGLRAKLFAVANGSRRVLESISLGFAATPSANRQEAVLSPAGVGNNPPATTLTFTVNSFFYIKTGGKVTVKVTRQDASFYTQVVKSVFILTPDQAVTIQLTTAETVNTPITAIWS